MIRIEHEGAVASIVLDRAESRNAMTAGMMADIARAVDDISRDGQVRCLAVRGEGEHFCAGRDLTQGEDRNLGPAVERYEAWTDVFRRLDRLAIPSVAVVQGYAVAGGFTLAMGCDFVIAERSAQFGVLEMRSGFPAAVNTPLLAQLVGSRLGLEMLLFGEMIDAARLYEMGLVNRLADGPEELARVATRFIARAATLNPEGVKLTKALHRAARSMPRDDALAMGTQLNALIATSGTFDAAADRFRKRETD